MAEPRHRLVKARENAGLSLGQAARLFGYERLVFERMELAPELPDALTLARMSRAYQVNIPWLVGEAPEMVPASELNLVCVKGKPTPKDLEVLRTVMASMRRGSPKPELVISSPPKKER